LNRGRLDSWDRRILTLLFIVTSGFTLIEVGLDSLIWLERWVCWFDWNTGFAALTGTLGSLTTLHWFFYPARRTIFCGVFDTLDCISIYIRLQQMYKDGVSRPFVSSCYMFCSYLSTCYLFWVWSDLSYTTLYITWNRVGVATPVHGGAQWSAQKPNPRYCKYRTVCLIFFCKNHQ
jgi:hypothetical protein